jgi:hypothetical protein
MALREFSDGNGVLWRVWDVTPDALSKRTAAEDYMRDWQDGWLCFESDVGRRRLADFPPGWESLNDAQLERLLQRAQEVKASRASTEMKSSEGDSAGQAPP